MNHNLKSKLVRNLRIDLTPMVDISFILIMAFFIVDFYRQENFIDFKLPEIDDCSTDFNDYSLHCDSNPIVVFIESNGYVVHTKSESYVALEHLNKIKTNMDLRAAILFQRKNVIDTSRFLVVIKPTPRCNYDNFVKVLNEVKIVKSNYRIDDMNKNEALLLAELK